MINIYCKHNLIEKECPICYIEKNGYFNLPLNLKNLLKYMMNGLYGKFVSKNKEVD